MRDKNRMLKLLESEDYRVSASQNPCVALFRKLLKELQVTEVNWGTLLEEYLDTRHEEAPVPREARSTKRGNLNRELSANDFSWKVFHKGLRLLSDDFVAMEIEVKHIDKTCLYRFDEFGRYEDREMLARMLKTLMQGYDVGVRKWSTLMNAYLMSPELGLPRGGVEFGSQRSEVGRKLMAKHMTWKTFMVGLQFMAVTQVRMTIFIKHRGNEVKQSLSFKLNRDVVGLKKRLDEAAEMSGSRRVAVT